MKRRRCCPPIPTGSESFAGFRFPPEVIVLAGRWYLRYGLSYRDLEELLADTTQYANNRVENDHGRPKTRLQPTRGLQTDRTASVIIRGHAFMQNLRRGHYELGIDALPGLTVAAAFDELAAVV